MGKLFLKQIYTITNKQKLHTITIIQVYNHFENKYSLAFVELLLKIILGFLQNL